MKLQFETIQPLAGSSFTLLHTTNVEGSQHVLWHYHPEYELVYIPYGRGRRHIGQHHSQYEDGELVFIGPHVPHLSFSYGRQNPYEQIVLQLPADWLATAFGQLPELEPIKQLFHRAQQGLSFGAQTRARVAPLLQQMLTQPAFPRLLSVLQLFQHLTQAPDVEVLHADRGGLGQQGKEKDRLSFIYRYVQEHYAEPIEVSEVAELAHLTVPAFCRYFKKMTGQTLTAFVQDYRISQACLLLLEDRPITEVSFASGFNNLSHFNKTFRRLIGQSPTAYRQQQQKIN
ncbi:AraC family transcriptional regulator [Hymenobacter sp. HDW8]|uniref:AraC family transcriptional regulator n=1 Tax=Hymenobacter sp. HDW8 TaxID=2714932 RepID=UPI001409CA95|nr:AraC family transcriptional regulator [Hymenobacter sp. HDW8]QIL74858.1 helix-turn-helix transcriptional regulator [Hymenobacter sp. HDW8]